MFYEIWVWIACLWKLLHDFGNMGKESRYVIISSLCQMIFSELKFDFANLHIRIAPKTLSHVSSENSVLE